MNSNSYVLITAARDEELHIPDTIRSVAAQTIKPKKWIIISDGSTDRTDDIIKHYSKHYDFIFYLRKERVEQRNGFASKVYALQCGHEMIKGGEYHFIGHLDADVSFEESYFECLLRKFKEDRRLGICGGFIYEKNDGEFKSRASNRTYSVAGAVQLFRRECYEEIGGLKPLEVGGEDWYLEIMARMKGWKVESFADMKVFHHKKSHQVRGVFKEALRQGKMDYMLGSHPLFEVAKSLRRFKERPFPIHPLLRMAGFGWAYLSRERRPVSMEIVAYLRKDQLERLKAIFTHSKR
jgi:glycosyltransferase involved in cell wall biosynthesis